MNKRQLISSLLLCAALPIAAQKLVATKTTIDVGKTGYQQPITAVFEFRNKGLRKLKIKEIRPDCYCTAIDYPKEDIGSGDVFQVRMTYDAKQLGHFDKQAAVISNGTDKPLYIRMKGVVLEHYRDLSKSHPVAMGDLRLNKDQLEFDDVNRGSNQVQELMIYNNGTRAYKPNLMHLPSYLTATMMPETLKPDEEGKMTVTLNSDKVHDNGLTQTTLYLAGNPGDKIRPDHEIGVSIVVLPPFDQWTETQRANAPRMVLSKERVDVTFGNKKHKSDVIEVSNNGKSNLNISSLQLFTGGLKVSLGKRMLKPGETTKLKITAYRDDLKKVRTRPRILMITNDPNKPKIAITINAQ